ncbi:MAG: hypothetical protein NVS2B6_09150 [Thermoleophilaceae bacterium]
MKDPHPSESYFRRGGAPRERSTAGPATIVAIVPAAEAGGPDSLSDTLSIVIPAFNEAAVIAQVLEELDRVVAEPLDAEIVVVDDCSSDGTGEILDRLAAQNPRLSVHHADQNGGHGPSVRRAIDASSGDWIFQVDSDDQFVPSEFWTLWERRERCDLAMGYRATRHDARHRLILSWVLRRLATLVTGGEDIRDVNVPFKLFRRAIWRDLTPAMPAATLIPSVLVAVGAASRGWRLDQVPITHLARTHGPSSLRPLGLARISARALAELAVFRLRVRRMAPLRAAG